MVQLLLGITVGTDIASDYKPTSLANSVPTLQTEIETESHLQFGVEIETHSQLGGTPKMGLQCRADSETPHTPHIKNSRGLYRIVEP